MRKFVLLFLTVLTTGSLLAQNRQISGTVSAEDGTPLSGVTIIQKGTSVGAISDHDGKFNILAAQGSTLVFSYLGYETKEVGIGAVTSSLEVVMASSATVMDNVVVTALGISRSEKSLGYAVSSVSSDVFEDGRESNIMNSLAGKVAGVNIMQNSGTAGGSSKIILRGQSSLSSAGQPLFVIDGVPVNNSTYNYGNNGAIDTGSRIGDIASDDIESMNVLKGAAATALYGARAKDGVVIITTKKGAKNQPISVSVNSSFRFDSALKLPDYQNEYGPGDPNTGDYSMGTWNGWGPKIEGQMVDVFFQNEQVPLKAYPNNVRDFFKGGTTFANSISMSGGDEKNDFRLGVSAFNQKGIVPENKYNRYNITFNGGRQFNKWFSARVSASYINAASEGRPAQGSNDKNVTLPSVMGMPRTMNTQWLKDHWVKDGKPYPLGSGVGGTNNPYWILKKNKYTSDVDRVIGSVYLELKPVKGLTISNNLGTDFFYDNSRRVWAKETYGIPKGKFETVNWNGTTLNNDFIASYNVDLGKGFGLKVLGGMNLLQITSKTLTVEAQDLLLPNVYSYANAEVTTPSNSYNRRRLVGVFGEVGVSYKDLLYLTVTGRNDWSSTMPKNHKSYFYPSVSASFLFSELIPQNKVLTFGKLRANFAMVGSDTDPYALSLTFSPQNSYFLQYLGADAGKIPHGGLLGYSVTGTYPSPGLEPQMKTEYEIGADLRFLNNRLRLDVTYYYNISKKNIARFDTPNSTGFFYYRKNAGEITNSGIEITLGGTPIKRAFIWDIEVNFATNKQKVKSLDAGMEEYSLTSGYSGLQIKAAVGESFSIYGKAWERDPDGNIVIDETTGLRKVTGTTRNLGKIAPDFTMGITNSFAFKGASLSFLIDIKKGGVMYSQTAADMMGSGLGKETLLNNREPIVDKGVNKLADGSYVPNQTTVSPYDYWSRNFVSTNTEGMIFDASYVKLREVVAGYTLPKSLLKNFPIKDIFIGFEARNLWIIHSNVPHIDPELTFFSSADVGYGVEFSGVPSTRSLGFNIKFNF